MVQRRESGTDPTAGGQRGVHLWEVWSWQAGPATHNTSDWEENCGETSSLRGKRKQPHRSQECFLAQIHTENIMKTQRTWTHVDVQTPLYDPSVSGQLFPLETSVHTPQLTLCRYVAVSVWFEGWGRVTVFSWGRRRRSAIPNLLMLTITALAWRAHATRVKRVMENKDHLTHHSRASEWVAGRRGGSHWTAMLWKDCSLLFAMKQVFVSPLSDSVCLASVRIKEPKKPEITSSQRRDDVRERQQSNNQRRLLCANTETLQGFSAAGEQFLLYKCIFN